MEEVPAFRSVDFLSPFIRAEADGARSFIACCSFLFLLQFLNYSLVLKPFPTFVYLEHEHREHSEETDEAQGKVPGIVEEEEQCHTDIFSRKWILIVHFWVSCQVDLSESKEEEVGDDKNHKPCLRLEVGFRLIWRLPTKIVEDNNEGVDILEGEHAIAKDEAWLRMLGEEHVEDETAVEEGE